MHGCIYHSRVLALLYVSLLWLTSAQICDPPCEDPLICVTYQCVSTLPGLPEVCLNGCMLEGNLESLPINAASSSDIVASFAVAGTVVVAMTMLTMMIVR